MISSAQCFMIVEFLKYVKFVIIKFRNFDHYFLKHVC